MKIKKGDLVYLWNIKSVFGINFECLKGTVVSVYQGNNEKCIKLTGIKFIGINFIKDVSGTEFNLSLKVFKVSKDYVKMRQIQQKCAELLVLCKNTSI